MVTNCAFPNQSGHLHHLSNTNSSIYYLTANTSPKLLATFLFIIFPFYETAFQVIFLFKRYDNYYKCISELKSGMAGTRWHQKKIPTFNTIVVSFSFSPGFANLAVSWWAVFNGYITGTCRKIKRKISVYKNQRCESVLWWDHNFRDVNYLLLIELSPWVCEDTEDSFWWGANFDAHWLFESQHHYLSNLIWDRRKKTTKFLAALWALYHPDPSYSSYSNSSSPKA